MEKRQYLVARWRERLAIGQRLLSNSSPRMRWLGAVYVRLYRFLLSLYSDGVWQCDTVQYDLDPSSLESHDPTSRMPFVDLTSHEPGTPAKTIDAIRATLGRVHKANAETSIAAPSPSTKPSDWIVVAAETDCISPRKCSRFLGSAKITSRIVKRGANSQVEVSHADFDRAMALVGQNKSYLRPTRHRMFSGVWLAESIGQIVATTFLLSVAIAIAYSAGLFGAIEAVWAFCLLGGISYPWCLWRMTRNEHRDG